LPKALSAVQGSPEAQQPIAQSPQALIQQSPQTTPPPVGVRVSNLLTVMQILLAVLALVTSAVTLYFRRAGRY
jgi:hypothetical protein